MSRFSTQGKYPPTHPVQRTIAASIVDNLIIDCSLPLSIVSHSSFRAHMEVVEPKFSHMSRTQVQRLIEDRAKKISLDVSKSLASADHISITLDIWSDRTMRGFVAITAHYVKGKCLANHLLTCERIIGRHTGERIHNMVKDCLKEFGILQKLQFIITDNAANMRKAFATSFFNSDEEEEVSETPQAEDVDDPKLWENMEDCEDATRHITLGKTRLSCFAHTLQLCVADGLKVNRSMRTALAKTSKLTSLLHTSTTLKDTFEKAFPNRSLLQPNSTRWNSTLTHIKSVIDLDHSALRDVLAEAGQDSLILTSVQYSQLQECVELLSPFLEATDICQGDKGATIGVVIPSVLALYSHLIEVKLNSLQSIRQQLLTSLKKRFSGVISLLAGNVSDLEENFGHSVYRVAALVDPCFHGWMDQYLDQDSMVLADLKKVIIEEAKAFATMQTPASDDDVNLVEPPPVAQGLFKKLKVPASNLAPRQMSAGDELAKFDSLAPSFAGTCLEFWTMHGTEMPILHSIILRVCSAPATSAPVERVFSHGGILMRPHRARMSSKLLSHLIYCKCNWL